MAGLQVGRALGCSGCLGLGSAVPAPPPPIFLGTQPPYATKALNAVECNLTELTRKSGCVPSRVCRIVIHMCQCIHLCQCSFMLNNIFEALAPVHAAGVCAPLHFAFFVHAPAPVHAWSQR